MARRHRTNFNDPGHAHELTFTCYRRFRLLESNYTCEWLASAIDHARRLFDFDLWAYVFMPEHAHVILCPRNRVYDIADIRKAIKAPVARSVFKHLSLHAQHWLPKLTRQRGIKTERLFWQSGGGYDRNITDGKTLLQMIDYAHMNPVRRGLASETAQWQWSSAAWYAGDRSREMLVIDPIPSFWLTDD